MAKKKCPDPAAGVGVFKPEGSTSFICCCGETDKIDLMTGDGVSSEQTCPYCGTIHTMTKRTKPDGTQTIEVKHNTISLNFV